MERVISLLCRRRIELRLSSVSSEARRLLHCLSGDHLKVPISEVSLKIVLPCIDAETNVTHERSWIVHGFVSFQVVIPAESARAKETFQINISIQRLIKGRGSWRRADGWIKERTIGHTGMAYS